MQTTTATTTATNYVFFNAESAKVKVYINNVLVAATNSSYRLAKALRKHNVNVKTATLAYSSSIDFATEEGFATDACAHIIIDTAIKTVRKYC